MFSFFKKKTPKKPSRAEIIAEAKANVKKATEEIGEETLDKVRAHLAQKENNPLEQAIRKIKAMDEERIADNIRATYREDR